MKKLPIGIQRFRDIIQENYLYVDKTKQIYDLINQGKLYFLSRPRRFGKSLLISTLQEIFQGNKDLFKGLYIAEKTDYDWAKHPVLSFNFAKLGHKVTDLRPSLKRHIALLASQYDIVLKTQSLSNQVEELVSTLNKQQGSVVFLVDEYDKPIVDFITDLKTANEHREILRDFFSPLKNLELQGHIRFLFITGVSKFSKVSIFSDLNNLLDLTIDPVSSDLVGITDKELKQYFGQHIQLVNQKLKMPEAELLKNIQLWYDGYSYDGETFLYNPFSLLNFFRKKRFGNFWFATGTPTFLVERIRQTNIQPMQLEQKEFLEIFFDRFTIEQLDIYNLLFQTGYLTIKSTRYDDFELRYKLGYPNREVQQSFIYNLLEAYTFQPSSVIGDVLLKIRDALREGQVEKFIDQLKILLSDISYHLFPKRKRDAIQQDKDKEFAAWEGYFQTVIYLITAFVGFQVQTEITKHKGRLDLLVEAKEHLYLMEFKLDEPVEHAIEQIKNRAYAASYKNSAKKVWLVGVGFSKVERNVAGWEVEEWER